MSPYVTDVERPFWRDRVYDIVDSVAEGQVVVTDGRLNYFITLLLLRLVKPKSYSDFQRLIGLVECVKLELYRAQVGPYEDVKRELNGEVA